MLHVHSCGTHQSRAAHSCGDASAHKSHICSIWTVPHDAADKQQTCPADSLSICRNASPNLVEHLQCVSDPFLS